MDAALSEAALGMTRHEDRLPVCPPRRRPSRGRAAGRRADGGQSRCRRACRSSVCAELLRPSSRSKSASSRSPVRAPARTADPRPGADVSCGAAVRLGDLLPLDRPPAAQRQTSAQNSSLPDQADHLPRMFDRLARARGLSPDQARRERRLPAGFLVPDAGGLAIEYRGAKVVA